MKSDALAFWLKTPISSPHCVDRHRALSPCAARKAAFLSQKSCRDRKRAESQNAVSLEKADSSMDRHADKSARDDRVASKASDDSKKVDSSGSLFDQALKEQEAKKQAEIEKIAQQERELEATAQAIKEANAKHQELKDASIGKAINDRVIKHTEPIALKHTSLPRESIAISDDEIIPLDLVIVKASDISPNFYASEFQPRTSKNAEVIEAIAKNFTPELILGRGGYKDLPIINKEGKVIIGNHRVQGFKEFSQASREAYQKAIKDRYGVELVGDELLLRIPSDSNISDEKLLAIAFHSNKDDIKTISDKVSAALGKYDHAIKELPNTPFTSESVEELKSKVAHALGKGELLPDERETNLALLASLARSSEQSDIIKAMNALPQLLAPQERQAVQNMFIDNAGSFYNLSHNTLEYGLRNIDLRPYIAQSIEATAAAMQKERWQNFEALNQGIKHLLDTTDEKGANALLETGLASYDDVISQALGASLARFARLENPSSNLYEALKNAPKELEALHAPAFDFESGGVTAGKRLQDMDILDLIEYLARTGEASQGLREFVDLLPSFRQKWQASKEAQPSEVAHTPAPTSPAAKATPKETPAEKPSTEPKVDSSEAPLKPATAQEAQKLIESITPAPMPAHLSEQEFLEGFEHFINKENFLAHLHKAQDSKQRIEALNLVEPTRKNADIELETINAKGEPTKEFIKVFEGENKRKFYVLVTQADNENILLTGIPTTKLREIRKRINNAKEIKARDSGVVSSAQSHNKTPTPSRDSTTKTQDEIKEIIAQWDLSPSANASTKQRAIIAQVSDTEAELLQKDFNFKGKKPLVREIDSHQIIHTLKQHGDEISEAQRGQEAISLDDIAGYETITQKHDMRVTQDNGKILYAKQVNGHFVVVEEVLEGQDKVRFFDMWKQKGKLNKEVLLSHSQRPNTSPSPSLESRMPSSTSDSTTKTFNQGDIKLESLQDFSHYARLAGFENLSQEQLEKAHAHILQNLHKIEC